MVHQDEYPIRMGRDQFFETRPRPKNQTCENSERDQEKGDADLLPETRLSHFFCLRQDLT